MEELETEQTESKQPEQESIQQEYKRAALRQKMIPHSITAMVFGIVSIAVMCYFGWVAAIVALVLYNKGMKIYNENPPDYKPSSLGMMRTAKICGIIGLIVSIVVTLLYILYIVLIAGLANYAGGDFHF
ncbi:MAG TPA: CCC motif membrane protein [Bacteroidales bacterium]|nr:CCC motif membrane protein [Bacteroidales bacterium]